ncbi:MAG: threonylcarbamoyl-AMP synthase [Herminiimonas sp.]|nr:threonylcarbamoyl-AMP synthase [Herminiimonas sp.]
MNAHHADLAAIGVAARLLEAGELVAFPTETVYGLGADAENPTAIAKIYAAKGRPSNHPVIVHIASHAEAARWAADLPEQAHRLIAAFWPGPLTLIVKRAASISAAVSGGQDTIGLRCPSHPVAQALMHAFKNGKGGIAAPSANKFGHVSPTTAQHVRDEFGADGCGPVRCVLEGGQSTVGIESTIVDLSRMATLGPVLLRPGSISVDAIEAIIGLRPMAPDQGAPRVSGSLQSHYAPRSPVALVASADCATTLRALLERGRSVAVISTGAAQPETSGRQAAAVVSLPAEPSGYAHGLYAALRQLDAIGADLILVEAPPRDAAWSGVWDRLQRAAHDSTGTLQSLLA